MRIHVLILLLLTAFVAHAQTLPDLSDAGFQACALSEVEEGEDVLILSFADDGLCYALSQTASAKTSGKKLAAVLASELTADVSDKLRWRVEEREGGGIRLLTADGEKGLAVKSKSSTDIEVAALSKATTWIPTTAVDGNAMTLAGESGGTKYLGLYTLGAGTAYFGYYTESGADNIRLYFYRAHQGEVTPPTSELREGTLKLRGAWTAEGLADISWEGVGALDLTAIRLPANAQAFRHRPTECNVPIYVAEKDRQRVPATWSFVVCGSNLLTPVTLHDALPLQLPMAFSVTEGQLSYERRLQGDGAWETLILPFDAAVPEGFSAYELAELRTEELLFTPATRIRANVPVLLRPNDDNRAAQTLRISSSATTVETASATSSAVFRGTYTDLLIEEDMEGIYFLDTTGTGFARAAAGSHLRPFRAYILTSSALSAPRIVISTSISSPTLQSSASSPLRDLRGLPVRGEARGIVIDAGRKRLIPIQ